MDENSKDLVARMLMTRDPETGAGFTDEEIQHEMLTFFIAGYDTTAGALQWTFYQLSQHPEVLAELQREVDAVTGGAPLAMHHLPKLTYTKRVIDEVMRISPSAWFMGRETVNETNMGGNVIKKGAFLCLAIPSLHHNPALWPNPDKFDPDRFLPEAVANRSPNAYLPFSRGEHACIGKHFVLQELVIMTATLAGQYGIVLDQKFERYNVTSGISMSPKGGLRMRVVRRAQPLKASA